MSKPKRANVRHASTRTFDGRTGRLVGGLGATGATGSDYASFSLPAGVTGSTGLTDAAGSPLVLPTVSVSASPLSSIPWWLWIALGIGGGYFLARQYGNTISRGLKHASAAAAPR